MNKITWLFLLAWFLGGAHHGSMAANFEDEGTDGSPRASPFAEWVKSGLQESAGWLGGWFKGTERQAASEYHLMPPTDEEDKKHLAESRISSILSGPGVKGREATCEKFLRGVVIFRPKATCDDGMVVLRICDLPNPLGIGELDNPLDSAFDLSDCLGAGKYIMLATGYRKSQQAGSIARSVDKTQLISKTQIWITPLFLLEQRHDTYDYFAQYNMNLARSRGVEPGTEVGIFLNWGLWNDPTSFIHLSPEKMEDIGTTTFFDKWSKSFASSARWGDTSFLIYLPCLTLKF